MYGFRRRLVWSLLGLVLSACVGIPQTGNLPAASVPLPSTIRVCTSYSSAQMNVQVALAQELDKKYGIDLDVTVVQNAATAATALISGGFDVCQTAGAAAINAIAAGGDLVLIGSVLNHQPYYLITRKDIVQPSDLIGQALAISGPGTSSDFATRTALEHLGLRPEQDVTLLTVGSASDRIAAMQNGAVAGTILAPPEAMTVLAAGNHMMLDFSALDNEYQHIAIIATRTFVHDHPDLVEAYLRATSAAVARMQSDKSLAIAAMAAYLELDPIKDANALDLTYDLVIQKQMHVNPRPSLSSIQAVIDELAKEHPAVTKLKPEDVVELTAVEKLESEGFFQSLQTPAK